MDPAHKNPVAVQFGRNLRRCRLKTGLSQEGFASRVGVHRTEISMLELGHREPKLSTVLKMAGAAEVSVEQLTKNLGIHQKHSIDVVIRHTYRGRGSQ